MSGGLLDGLLDFVFPKRCVVCGAAGDWLCEPCSGGLHPLPAARCARCGAPLGGPGALAAARRAGAGRSRPSSCRECRGRGFAFVGADAAFVYDDAARALVTACKFRALRSLVDELVVRARPAFVAACARTGTADDLVVTAVPGHREHSLERGFNQAELLARGLAREARVTYAPLLRRARHGARQSGLDRAARAANVRDAFALREDVNGVRRKLKRVVIVDDVYTTGETLNQCAEALARTDLEPRVFTFARTVRATTSQASRKQAVPKERCR